MLEDRACQVDGVWEGSSLQPVSRVRSVANENENLSRHLSATRQSFARVQAAQGSSTRTSGEQYRRLYSTVLSYFIPRTVLSYLSPTTILYCQDNSTGGTAKALSYMFLRQSVSWPGRAPSYPSSLPTTVVIKEAFGQSNIDALTKLLLRGTGAILY